MSAPDRNDLHPPDAALAEWLDASEVDPGVDAHVADCDVCAERIELLGTAGSTSDLGPVLRLVTEPPPDLHEKLERRLGQAALERETKSLIGELFGLGGRTAKLLMDPEGTND